MSTIVSYEITMNDFKFIADGYLKEQTLLFLKKNKDYGDSFIKSMKKFGDLSALVRMDDKMNRYLQLKGSDVIEVQDEKIDDTLLDLLNYIVMFEAYKKHKALTVVDYLDTLLNEVYNLYVLKNGATFKVLTKHLNYDSDEATQVCKALQGIIIKKLK